MAAHLAYVLMAQDAKPDDDPHQGDAAGSMDDLIFGFSELDDSYGLEELSQAYAQLLAEQDQLNVNLSASLPQIGGSTNSRFNDPSSSETSSPRSISTTESGPSLAQKQAELPVQPADRYLDLRRMVEAARSGEPDDRVAVTPIRIVESLLFVGADDNSPLSGRVIASLMRGVSPEEVDSMVDDLNKGYESDDAAYRIVRHPLGFQMELAPSHASMRQRFYGQVREAKLPQPVIDVLALVAYHQPVARKQVEKLIGSPCGSALNQLLRRNLIQLSKEPELGAVYRTTARFLELFDLGSLDDLPQSESIDSNS